MRLSRLLFPFKEVNEGLFGQGSDFFALQQVRNKQIFRTDGVAGNAQPVAISFFERPCLRCDRLRKPKQAPKIQYCHQYEKTALFVLMDNHQNFVHGK